MDGYYRQKLSAQRLKQVYEIAPPRIRRYLAAELAHVLTFIRSGDRVLDLGCGYGRTLPPLAVCAGQVVGIDSSFASLDLGRPVVAALTNCHLACMGADRLAFPARIFDLVVCIQNGISAFHVDQQTLIAESVRVTRSGGTILFSTYSPHCWDDRLDWFERQAAAGLLGEIDHEQTGDGEIVCRDGFRATTITPDRFRALARTAGLELQLTEVDQSSLFACMCVPKSADHA